MAPTTPWSMAEKGLKRIEVAALNDKRQVTATLAVTMSGMLLPVQILYQGKTERCHPTYKFPDDFDIYQTHNHWANGQTVVRYIKKIILPYVEKVKLEKQLSPDQPSLILCDVFRGHETEEVDILLKENKLLKVLIPI